MEIQFTSTIGVCTEFITNGKKQEISIVVSPLKVSQTEDTIKVISGCSMWKSCQNRGCQFSLIARGDGAKSRLEKSK